MGRGMGKIISQGKGGERKGDEKIKIVVTHLSLDKDENYKPLYQKRFKN